MAILRLLTVLLLAAPVARAALDPDEERIVAAVDARREAAVDLLARAVDVPSATENLAGVRQVGEIFAGELRELGFATRWVEVPPAMGRAGHLVAEHPGSRGAGVLLIGHLDTVLEGEPFRREGGRAWGSGAEDMKGGDVVLVEALRALHATGALADRRVVVVMTGDEEKPGRPLAEARRALIEAAGGCQVALGFEGSLPGVAVVGRRGISEWTLEVSGQQGHSGALFGEALGSGAVYEVSRILAAFHQELREPDLTINPSVLLGGTDLEWDPARPGGTAAGKTNVVARRAVASGDLRYLTPDQLRRTRERMLRIVAANLPRTRASLTFLDGYPSMAPEARHRALLSRLDQVSRDLGGEPMVAHDPGRRGAADISFVADRLAGLDGLGAAGDRDHAPGEWVDLDALPLLTRRAALLIYRLTR